MKAKWTLALLFLLEAWTLSGFAQNAEKLSLKEAIHLAQQRSLDALAARQDYLAECWGYKASKAEVLPQIGLEATPVSFNRTIVQRYDVIEKADVFVPQQNLFSSATLRISKVIGSTGGRVFFSSDWSRLQNFAPTSFVNYSIAPARLGIDQPLGQFNPFKWEKKLAPLRQEIAEKVYSFTMEEVALKTTRLFFDFLKVQEDLESLKVEIAWTDSLIGLQKQRHYSKSYRKEDQINLHLQKLDYQQRMEEMKVDLIKKREAFYTYLRLDVAGPGLSMPSSPPAELRISWEELLLQARRNHPLMLIMRKRSWEGEMQVEKARKDNRFQASVQASLGLNQSDTSLRASFSRLLDQEMIFVSLEIPLWDWGRRKGIEKVALARQEAERARDRREETEFYLKLKAVFEEFSSCQKRLDQNAKAIELSTQELSLLKKRFRLGQSDIYRVNMAENKLRRYKENRWSLVANYWTLYRELRASTLFDFELGRGLAYPLPVP